MVASNGHEGQVLNANTNQHKGRNRIIIWLFGTIIGIALFFLIATPIFLSSESGKRLVLNKINAAVDGTVQAKSFSLGWFKGIELADITFSDNSGTAAITASRITLKPKFLSLMMGDLALGPTEIEDGNIKINSPYKSENTVEFRNIAAKMDTNPAGSNSTFDLALEVNDGKKNSSITAKGNVKPSKNWTLKGTSGDVTVKIDKLNLKSLAPLFALMDKKFDATGILNANIRANIDDGNIKMLNAEAKLSGLGKTDIGKPAAPDEPIEIIATISSKGDQVNIEKLSIVSSFCRMDGKGGTDKLDYTATADLKGLQDFAAQFMDFGDYKLSGDCKETGKLTFNKGVITATGTATISDFTLQKKDRKSSPVDIAMDWQMATDKDKQLLKIASFNTVSNSIGQIKVADSIIPISSDMQDRLNLNLSADLRLKNILQFANALEAVTEDASIAGDLASKIHVTSKENKYHIVTDNTKITGLVIGRKDKEKEPYKEERLTLSADVLCDPVDKTVQINTLKVDSSQFKITKGTLLQSKSGGNTKMTGNFEVEYDLKAISEAASAFLPEELTLEGKRKHNINIESLYPTGDKDKMVANLKTHAKLGFKRAEYMGLNFGPTDIDLKIANGKINIAPFSSDVNGGKLNFAANIDLNKDPRVLSTPQPLQIADKVKISAKMNISLLRYVLPFLAGQDFNKQEISGIASFHCKEMIIPFGENLKENIYIVGTISLDDAHISKSGLMGQIMPLIGGGGTDLTIKPTDFKVAEGKVSYEKMEVVMGGQTIILSGATGLDKKFYDMVMKIPYTIGGAVSMATVPIQGTLDSPGVNIEKLLQGETIKILEEELKKGLENLFK
jgi:hypothetical protein